MVWCTVPGSRLLLKMVIFCQVLCIPRNYEIFHDGLRPCRKMRLRKLHYSLKFGGMMQLTMKQITVWNGHTQLMFASSDLSRPRVLLFSERLVCTLDHDWLVHYIFPTTGHILLFSCAYLKCDKEGSFHVFKWVHIPLILYQYISYIVPIFLFP